MQKTWVFIEDRIRNERIRLLLDTQRRVNLLLENLISEFGLPRRNFSGTTLKYQLVRARNNQVLPGNKTLEELRIARVLERNFAKDEILEMYLNMIYFGHGEYGLKAASERTRGDPPSGSTPIFFPISCSGVLISGLQVTRPQDTVFTVATNLRSAMGFS